MKKTLYFSIFLLCIHVTHAQIPSYVPTNGLVAWWGFNGNTNDQSTSANHLTNTGATLTTDRFGAANAAYLFNGTNNYMIRQTPSFTLGQTSSFSISWWVQRSNSGYGVAMMHGSTANNNFIWNIQTAASNSDMMFGTNKQGSAWVWTSTQYTVNQWDHFVAVFASGTITLYKNGLQATTNSFTHTGSVQTNLPINIGRGVLGNYFSGKMDDIGIWTRVLTPTEISLL